MDLRIAPAEPTPLERAAIDAVVGAQEPRSAHVALGGHAARERHDLLLPALHAAQAARGWISREALAYICDRLTVPPADAYGVASFYAMFSLQERAATVAHVCDDIACRANGSEALIADLERRPRDPAWEWHRSPCLGQCERGPAVLLQRSGTGAMDEAIAPADAGAVAARAANPAAAADGPAVPQAGSPELRLLRRIGRIDPASVDDHLANEGGAALRKARDLGPAVVIAEIKASRLAGRGGAAFPMGVKWESVAAASVRPHYVVCNADESESGTFKDRVLMEGDPFALVEAIALAAFAVGADRAFLYVRGEYPLAAERMAHAIRESRARGLIGELEITLRRGAGAYICGEETALFNSIEGKRGEPRNKPPFPVTHGLFGKPTAINNVETLLAGLEVVRLGGAAYAGVGTQGSTGTKLFCVSGTVRRPGVYEVPFGPTLRQILELAGGMREGRSLRAVLLGGAAGSFLTPDEIDVPLTYEGVRAIGASLGSGVVLAFDDSVDLDAVVKRIARFFREESCGQCVPCRVGTQRQVESLDRLALTAAADSRRREIALLDDLAGVMRDASICGLGHTASGAVRSAIAKLGVLGGGS
ncbi:MAG: NADH-quinone oxidoreductase subunit E [Chloroflexi bacterium]|nr:NADH-quinone oxidoreductase subunit E [Chloroflexota bacterium]